MFEPTHFSPGILERIMPYPSGQLRNSECCRLARQYVCGASHETASETLSPQPRAVADEVDSLGSCSIVERVEQT